MSVFRFQSSSAWHLTPFFKRAVDMYRNDALIDMPPWSTYNRYPKLRRWPRMDILDPFEVTSFLSVLTCRSIVSVGDVADFLKNAYRHISCMAQL